jgi:N,N'-diacetylchitobiose transport system substrate-binding protein
MRCLRAAWAVLVVLLLTANSCSAPVERLEVWIMDGTHYAPDEFFDHVAATYTQATGIDLAITYVPWNEASQRLDAAAQQGSLPDVAEIGTTWTPRLAADDRLLDLTDRLDDPRRYIPELLVAGTHSGRVYGVPWYAGIRALVYRGDILDDLDMPPPADWSELRAVATAAQREHDVVGFPVPGEAEHALIPFLWGAGGGIAREGRDGTWDIRIDSAESRHGLGFYTDLAVRYGVSPPEAVGWREDDVYARFAEGEIAMALMGNWTLTSLAADAPELMGDLGAVPVPGPGGDPSPSFVGGSHLVVFDGTGKEGESWTLVETLTDPEHAGLWGRHTGYFPGPRDALAGYLHAADPLMEPFVTQLDEAAATYPVAPSFEAVQQERVLLRMLQDVLAGEANVGEATATAAQDLDRLLNEE